MQILRRVTPTSEQLPILGDVTAGFRLIRGAAGSGKTTVAVMRLHQLCVAREVRKARLGLDEPVRVLVLAFNSTLRGYVEQLAAQQVGSSPHFRVTVETFGKWAKELCGIGRGRIVERGFTSELRAAGFTTHERYFANEVEYILGRFPPQELERYVAAQRTGRGRAPAVPRAARERLLAEVVGPYVARKERRGLLDWNDVALAAAAEPSRGYDVVVVDEAQDLSANQVRALTAHLAPDHSTTFIVDAVQRIYPQAFTWREVGIEVRPEMVYTLGRNHRNTAAVARLAASLVRDLPREEDGVLPDPEACEIEGALPQVVSARYGLQLDFMLGKVADFLGEGDTVAILHPLGGGWFSYTRQELRRRGVAFCELTRERDWPSGSEQVGLSTIHSVKGLEFDHVLLPGLSDEVTPHGREEGDGTLEWLRRLLAMGIGRARKTVTLGYGPDSPSTLIGYLDRDLYELVRLGG